MFITLAALLPWHQTNTMGHVAYLAHVLMRDRMLEESLKAMLTSLPLVQELHHPAMRDRHWQQLMSVSPTRQLDYSAVAPAVFACLLRCGHHQGTDASEGCFVP